MSKSQESRQGIQPRRNRLTITTPMLIPSRTLALLFYPGRRPPRKNRFRSIIRRILSFLQL